MRAGPRRIRDDEEGGAGTGGGEGGCGKAESEAADKSKRPPAPSSVVCVRDRGRREGRARRRKDGREQLVETGMSMFASADDNNEVCALPLA